jgi:hypothetical protein
MVRPHNGALQATGPRLGSMASVVLAGVWGSPRNSSAARLRTARGPWQAAEGRLPGLRSAHRLPPATANPFV